MSGLAARFHRDGRPVEPSAIWAMLDAVPYRGPDGASAWSAEHVGLGHAKLAMTPEDEAEQQPLVSPRSGCVIVADARLDNRDDLLSRLPERPAITASDAELILRAYEAWGVDGVVKLLGDFAFVIWDPRQQRVVAARDAHGQRWLHYRIDRGTFAAASEIHQLFQDPSVAIVPNEAAIRDLLVPINLFRNAKDQAATYYEGIYSLPAGHTLVVDHDHVHMHQYWELRPPRELRYRSDAQYEEHFLDLLSEVIRTRLRSSRPMGAMLSGGLDSSTVVCTAQELYRAGRAVDRGFVGFSLVFDGLECDEQSLIRDVQTKYNLDIRTIPPSRGAGWLDPEPRGFLASPLAGSPMLQDLYATASQAGVRALLTGDVADSCLRGTRMVFDSLLLHGGVREFQRHWRAYRRVSGESLKRSLVTVCITPMLPLPVQKWLTLPILKRDVRRTLPYLVPGWLTDNLQSDVGEKHLRLSLDAERRRQFANPTRALEHAQLAPPEFANAPTGWPLEVWRPFADRRLHEFLLAIPPEQKFSPHPLTDDDYAASKSLMRRAMRGILPESIRGRTTATHFGSFFLDELLHQWPAYEAAFGPGSQPEVVARGWVDQQRFWERLQRLRQSSDYGNDLIYIMRMAAIETWLRTFKQTSADRFNVAQAGASHSRSARTAIDRRTASTMLVGDTKGPLVHLAS
jgi:asparagine synthase (glutamine-hydrolysing)